jgi:hypothetical protein
MKSAIQIDVQAIMEVLLIRGAKGVHRPLIGRESVHIGGIASFTHFSDDIQDWTFYIAFKDKVLKDVKGARVIGGDGFEVDAESIVGIGWDMEDSERTVVFGVDIEEGGGVEIFEAVGMGELPACVRVGPGHVIGLLGKIWNKVPRFVRIWQRR